MTRTRIDKDELSAEACLQIFEVWCEINPSMRGSTVCVALQRIKALEGFWLAWKAVRASNCGYHVDMPAAVKGLDKADKELAEPSAETEGSDSQHRRDGAFGT